MLPVDEDRVIADLRALADFGKVGTGVNRPAFSDTDLTARRWLMGEMQAAGLDAVIDGVGNVYGRAPAVKHSLLIGSHSDTVPNGGWLDGALGVIFGLEIARAARRAGGAVGVDVISFADEEGTWVPCLGSRAFCGDIAEAAWIDVTAKSGERLRDRLQSFGLAERPLARLDPDRHGAYLEAHIEQGPRLVADATDIGVVTGIVGLRRYIVHFTGRADHAGTTPMGMRRDAASTMFRVANTLADKFHGIGGPDSVWNFGVVTVRPGAANVVPAEAELTVEFRDLDPAVIERMDAAFHEVVRATDGAGNVAVSSRPNGRLEPVAMDGALMDTLAAAATESGASHKRLSSGAGHDAMILARRVPSAMMFVPSIDGRSHDTSENTAEADIRRGFRVFAAAAAKTLERLARDVGPLAASSSGARVQAS